MLFALLKLYARFALKIYCRNIIINKPEYLEARGPLLLAANHPNSFLDGMIMTTLFHQPVYSLARGDAFINGGIKKLLRWLRLLPVYRTSEGVENLHHNYTTFAACADVFSDDGVVIIFSEGACVNEWHLRPLKKGTARLAMAAWQKGLPLTVLPVGFNYSLFRGFGKNVHINFGAPLDKASILQQQSEGKSLLQFNSQLETQLRGAVYEIHPEDKEKLEQTFYRPPSRPKKLLLGLPALLGWMAHAPLYYPVKSITGHYFKNDHYDSVVTAVLMLAYPFYLLFWCSMARLLFSGWAAATPFLVLPFCAWACVQLKKQVPR